MCIVYRSLYDTSLMDGDKLWIKQWFSTLGKTFIFALKEYLKRNYRSTWKNNKKMKNLYGAIYRESLITYTQEIQEFFVSCSAIHCQCHVKKSAQICKKKIFLSLWILNYEKVLLFIRFTKGHTLLLWTTEGLMIINMIKGLVSEYFLVFFNINFGNRYIKRVDNFVWYY